MPGYVYFFLACLALVAGYFVYGKFVERVFGPRADKVTPAVHKCDGVDYVTMPKWKLWLIQLLNIAGVGPVFGPIMGALYGPTALLWIVIGSIFAGAVHDYFAGMMSVRYGGANVPDVVGNTLGKYAKGIMNVFAVLLLLLVGVVFATAPAGLLTKLTGEYYDGIFNYLFWIIVIFGYYFIATLLPIDKIIGKLYPFFGALLLFMAAGMTLSMLIEQPDGFYSWASFDTGHPNGLPIWPLVFITIACGALSGFHATQSPLMARCIANETEGRFVFYGAMISEGFIGLVWCTVGMTFYPDAQSLLASIKDGGAANVVYESSLGYMGALGGLMAVLGVIVLPITSGDTAFRAARLTIADAFKLDQKPRLKRLLIAIPLFAAGFVLSSVDFSIIWRYFGWSNQTLAAILLWAAAVYLFRQNKLHWICTVPAFFITAISVSYICYEPNMGFKMDVQISNIIGLVFSAVCLAAMFIFGKKVKDPEE